MTREKAGTHAEYHQRGTPSPMEISMYLKSSQAMRPVSSASTRKKTAETSAPKSTSRRRRARHGGEDQEEHRQFLGPGEGFVRQVAHHDVGHRDHAQRGHAERRD